MWTHPLPRQPDGSAIAQPSGASDWLWSQDASLPQPQGTWTHTIYISRYVNIHILRDTRKFYSSQAHYTYFLDKSRIDSSKISERIGSYCSSGEDVMKITTSLRVLDFVHASNMNFKVCISSLYLKLFEMKTREIGFCLFVRNWDSKIMYLT